MGLELETQSHTLPLYGFFLQGCEYWFQKVFFGEGVKNLKKIPRSPNFKFLYLFLEKKTLKKLKNPDFRLIVTAVVIVHIIVASQSD